MAQQPVLIRVCPTGKKGNTTFQINSAEGVICNIIGRRPIYKHILPISPEGATRAIEQLYPIYKTKHVKLIQGRTV